MREIKFRIDDAVKEAREEVIEMIEAIELDNDDMSEAEGIYLGSPDYLEHLGEQRAKKIILTKLKQL